MSVTLSAFRFSFCVLQRLPDQIKERNEKMKEEMLGACYLRCVTFEISLQFSLKMRMIVVNYMFTE